MTCNHCFDRLVDLVKTLRGEGGCPWDRAQTPEKIKVYLIEEAYEVLAAIETRDPQAICGELGDLLFHIVFLARIFEEAGAFDVQDVLCGITEKMTRRHPHVFGSGALSDVSEVKAQWHKIKAAESREKHKGETSILDTVPVTIPPLLRAYRLKERVSRLGAGPADFEEAFTELEKRIDEVGRVVREGENEALNDVYGDALLAMVDLGLFMSGVHPETALAGAVSRFVDGFRSVEKTLKHRSQ